MKYTSRVSAILLLCLSLGPSWLSAHAADKFPSKQVTIVVPFLAGGAVDLAARTLAEHMRQRYNVPAVVENRPGAGESIGVRQVIAAAPDGHTVLLGTVGGVAIAPQMLKDIGYDTRTALEPVALAIRAPNLLVVNAGLPIRNLRELVQYAKAHPGKLSYASSGVGTPQHLSGEMLKSVAGIDLLHIPYKGAAAGVVDVAGGQVSMTFASPATVRPHIEKGTLVALGVTMPERLASMPDVPIMKEEPLLADYDLQSWFGMFAPAGTPPNVLDKLNAIVTEGLNEPKAAERMRAQAGEPTRESREAFKRFFASEYLKFGEVLKGMGSS